MNPKQLAGERAVEFIEDGMDVGLGTGSTAHWAVLRLGERVRDEGLRVRAVPTSQRTAELAAQSGIELVTFADVQELDLTIDGADEINPALDLVKGGGGALLREKLVAAASRRFIVIADASKRVAKLGAFPLPVEIVPFAWEVTKRRLTGFGINPTLRTRDDGATFITDNGNYILDCACGSIDDPPRMERELKLLTGVVEVGLFTGMADTVVLAGDDGIELIERQK